jgi:hypothetical protein
MKFHRLCLIAGVVAVFLLPAPVVADKTAESKSVPSIASILKPGLPLELVSARKADRIAWVSYEEGKRNVYGRGAAQSRARHVAPKDDGVDLQVKRDV